MPSQISIEELTAKVGNKFLLTTAVARRAMQINEGDTPLVEPYLNERPVEVALREMQNEKIIMGLNAQKTISRSEAIFQEEDVAPEQEEDEELSEEEKAKALKKEEKAKKALAKKKKTKSLMA